MIFTKEQLDIINFYLFAVFQPYSATIMGGRGLLSDKNVDSKLETDYPFITDNTQYDNIMGEENIINQSNRIPLFTDVPVGLGIKQTITVDLQNGDMLEDVLKQDIVSIDKSSMLGDISKVQALLDSKANTTNSPNTIDNAILDVAVDVSLPQAV